MNKIENTRYLGALYGEFSVVELTGNESKEELLAIDNFVKFTVFMNALGYDAERVRQAIFRRAQQGVDVEKEYGLYREAAGGRPKVYIRPKVFAKRVADFETFRIQTPYQEIDPKGMTEEAFLGLKGVYKLRDIARTGFLPMHYQTLIAKVKELDRETCGVWTEGGLLYCDFEPFFAWIVSYKRNISLDESRQEIKAMKQRVAADKKKKKKTRQPSS